jgi:hypothetical protein
LAFSRDFKEEMESDILDEQGVCLEVSTPDDTFVRNRVKPAIKVITLSTSNGSALQNWIYGTQKLGYDTTILGLGEKWGGWPWRTKKYIKAISELDPGTLVVLVDGNDILFVRGPDALWEGFKRIDHPVVFGGESSCCVGKFSAYKFNGKRNKAIETIDSRLPCNRYKHPNVGVTVAFKEDLLSRLDAIKDEPDDQAGHLEKYLENPNYAKIDWHHSIVGNINKVSFGFHVDSSEDDELAFWNSIKTKDLPNQHEYKDSLGSLLYQNKETKGVPCILHFPGGNIAGYNKVGAEIYGSAFRPILPLQAQPVGKTALLSIANWWGKQ